MASDVSLWREIVTVFSDSVLAGWFLALSVLFIVNIAVRVIGLTWKNYFKSKWDLYSLAATTGAFVTTLLQFAGNSSNSPVFMQTQKLFLVSVSLSGCGRMGGHMLTG